MRTGTLLARTAAAALLLSVLGMPAYAGEQAAKLYEEGKFAEAEKAYAGLVESKQHGETVGAINQYAEQLLGLARAQAAASKWSAAEGNFERALTLAEAFSMPRSFVDQARAGLAEARARLGRPQSFSTVAPTTLEIGPELVNLPNNWNNGYIRNSFSFNVPDESVPVDPREQEYLRRCAIHYAKQVHGPDSMRYSLANLDLAIFYLRLKKHSAMAVPLDNAVSSLPKLSKDEQRVVGTAMLEAASEMINEDQLVQASYLLSPVTKYATADWGNLPQLADTLTRIANEFASKQDFAQAEAMNKHAISLLEHALGPKDTKLAAARMELAQLYIKENKDATAIELLEMAMPVLGDSVSSQTIKGYVALCQLYAKAGNEAKLKSAVASLSAAISRTGTDNDRSWYRSIFDVCALLARSGQTPLCRQLYTAAYKSAGQSNEMHSNGWDWYLNEGTRILVQQLVELGQLDEAENVHIASIDAFRSPGGEIAGISSAYTDLAEFYLTHGMDAKLQPAVDQLVAAVHKFGKNNNNHKLDELARKLESSKHYQACIQVAQAFIDSTPNGPRQEVQIAREYVMIGNAYMGLDNQEKAKEALGKALDEASRNLPPELSPLVAPVRAAIEKSVGDKHSSPLSSVITQLAEVSSYRDSNWDGNVSYRSNIMLNLARQFASQQMYAEADVCYKQALEWNNKAYVPSSIQSSGVMSSYASYLRSQGKGQQAQELSDAVEAINQVYQRQIRGESGVYRPFAPLTETIGGLKLRNTQADSST